MRMPSRSSVLTAVLALAGCPDDGGSSGDDAASSGASGSTAGADSTGAPPTTGSPTTTGPADSTGATTAVDTTEGMAVDSSGGTGDELMAFRFTEMYVRDPHFFVLALGVLCVDVTDSTPTGDPSINEQFNAAITGDDPMRPDGNLDLNLMLLFRPLDQSDGATGPLDFANGVCPVPPTVECDLAEGTNLDSSMYAVMQKGTCLEPDPAHLSSQNYNPQPGTTTGPCFVSDPTDVTIVTTDFQLPLADAEISAQFAEDPANDLVEGTLRGFLSMADATSIVLPDDIQMQTGAMTIAELLPGGAGNCAGHDDTDGDGWWMYVDFQASRVPTWLGP